MTAATTGLVEAGVRSSSPKRWVRNSAPISIPPGSTLTSHASGALTQPWSATSRSRAAQLADPEPDRPVGQQGGQHAVLQRIVQRVGLDREDVEVPDLRERAQRATVLDEQPVGFAPQHLGTEGAYRLEQVVHGTGRGPQDQPVVYLAIQVDLRLVRHPTSL